MNKKIWAWREPAVENKYNLDMKKIRELPYCREKVGKPLFWRNDVISAWCISGVSSNDEIFSDGFWIGIYDDDAPAYAGKMRIYFTSYGDMCSYNFNTFFRPEDIENEDDLIIQEKFLKKINELIESQVLSIKGVDK